MLVCESVNQSTIVRNIKQCFIQDFLGGTPQAIPSLSTTLIHHRSDIVSDEQ